MNAEALSRSLSHLPDDMIGEAIRSRAIKRIRLTPWLRAAACIAVVLGLLFGISFPWLSGEKYITAPSILAVKAYAFENGQPKEYELKEGATFYHTDAIDFYSPAINCVPGLPITFDFGGDNIALDIKVEKGCFIDWHHNIDNGKFTRREDNGTLGKSFSIANNRTIYWEPWEKGLIKGNTYVEVILKQNTNIVGYMVIKIKNTGHIYSASLEKSVYYPMVDGKYQEVTEEYVTKCIDKVKIFGV